MAVLAKEKIVDVGISLGFPFLEHKLGAMQVRECHFQLSHSHLPRLFS